MVSFGGRSWTLTRRVILQCFCQSVVLSPFAVWSLISFCLDDLSSIQVTYYYLSVGVICGFTSKNFYQMGIPVYAHIFRIVLSFLLVTLAHLSYFGLSRVRY